MEFSWTLILVLIAVLLFVALPLVLHKLFYVSIPKISLSNSRVIITGGSQGIGFEIAKYCISKGASVVLLARTQSKLDSAEKELSKHLLKPKYPNQLVSSIACDVSDYNDVTSKISNHLNNELKWSHIDALICNAGVEHVGKFIDTTIDKHKQIMDINYYGSVNSIYACYKYLANNSKNSRVIINCSALGFMGMMCYSSYCASKFALRGLVESIRNEFASNNIYLGIVYPPDVDTEQYQREKSQYNIPKEIRAISDDGGLFDAHIVGKDIGMMIENGIFDRKWGFEGWMLYNVHCGMGLVSSLIDTYAQIFLLGIFRMIAMGYAKEWSDIGKKCLKDKNVADFSSNDQDVKKQK